MVRRIAALVVILTIALASGAVAARSGVYRGVTNEKGLIRLTVRHNHVVHVFFDVTFFGRNCVVAGASRSTSVPIKHNRFRVTVIAGQGKIDVRLTGRFTGGRVTGTLNGTYGDTVCTTGNTTYKAYQ
jgi:hypothetical protein